MRLRWHLLALALVTLAPLVAFAIVVAVRLVEEERETFRRGAMERTLAMLTAVDAELKSSITALQALATDEVLGAGDLQAFHRRATRALGSQPGWLTITVALPSGQTVLDAARPWGSALGAVQERASFDRVLRTGAPAVGSLKRAPMEGRFDYAVRVPVVRDGAIAYVLSVFLEPDAMSALLIAQRIPPGWVGVLLDGDRRIIARTLAPERTVGAPASDSLRAALDRASEGWFAGSTVEGTRVYTPYNRSAFSGWTVAMGIPADVVEAAGRRTGWAMTGGVLGATLLALLFSLLMARRIAAPIALIAGAADAVGRGERPVDPARLRIAEVGALAHALDDAARIVRTREQELQDADRRKDEFLMLLSHELRTPMNAVHGWANMLNAGQLAGPARERALEAILRNSNAQIRLIDDLLDISRIIAGKTRLDVRPVDLHAVVQAAVESVRPAADAKEIRLQTVLDPAAAPITGDPARLQQVVWNLLINAVKFTPRGGRVQVHLQRVNSHVEVVVSDTGAGIGPDLLPVIFDRFRQADSSSTREHGGLGLGLALVRHLVELHGGSVVARSEGEGKGATFVVALPLRLALGDADPAPREHPTAADRVVAAPIAPVLEGVRVLVVDDDRDALALATAILTAARADVRVAASAALGLAELVAWRPDVVVADIEMPGEDGLSLIKKIRSGAAGNAGVPAIALTAYGRSEDRIRTLAAGFSMHVPKPVDPAELVAIVASLAGRDVSPRAPRR
jgi:signal transduction histidine kinase/ActR/RegA family two-component response regulator